MIPQNFPKMQKLRWETITWNLKKKTENNLNPKLSEKLLPLNITCLEGRSCCTTHTPDTGLPECFRIWSQVLTIFWQIYWPYLFESKEADHAHHLTLFLPGEDGISPLIVSHVTPPGRNRVKPNLVKPVFAKNFDTTAMNSRTTTEKQMNKKRISRTGQLSVGS